ncbi:hypothetical protein [Homoserinimonas hongtaonis]|uniref:hypothetical protein n=1 Tax=Homoserinimonas hongtaonis TaxID=2079791 RepID=UPI000D35F6D2|nr:hypothetical protein [Salinibacterium hongtaonis]AWB90234.1 hypothetical protein C2138_12370 [Salinibacterium hongtaonis]
MDFDEILCWAWLAVLFVTIGVLSATTARPKRWDRAVVEFAHRSGLDIDSAAVAPTVRRRIGSLTVARLMGALIGISVTAALCLMFPSWRTGQMAILLGTPLMFFGLTLGAVIVTLRDSLFTQSPESPRLARSMVPQPADYIDTRRRLTPTILLGAALLLGLVGTVLALVGVPAGRAYLTSPAIPLIIAACCSWVINLILTRRILTRPQPASTTLELRWDDALRADTLLNLAEFVSIVCWVSVIASVYGILGGIEPAESANLIVMQMFTWGMVISSLDSSLGNARRHVQWRLWPDETTLPPQQALA